MTGSGKTAAFILPDPAPADRQAARHARARSCSRPRASSRRRSSEHLHDARPCTRRSSGAAVFGGVGMGPQEHAFRTRRRRHRRDAGPAARPLQAAVRAARPARDPRARRGGPHARHGLPAGHPAGAQAPAGEAADAASSRHDARADRGARARDAAATPRRSTSSASRRRRPGSRRRSIRWPQELKPALFLELLKRGDMKDALVFTRTKHRANRLAEVLERGRRVGRAHSRQPLAGAAHGRARRLQGRPVPGARRHRHRRARHRRRGAGPRRELRRAERCRRTTSTASAGRRAPRRRATRSRSCRRTRRRTCARSSARSAARSRGSRSRASTTTRRRGNGSRSRSASASRRSGRGGPRSANAPRRRPSGARVADSQRLTPKRQRAPMLGRRARNASRVSNDLPGTIVRDRRRRGRWLTRRRTRHAFVAHGRPCARRRLRRRGRVQPMLREGRDRPRAAAVHATIGRRAVEASPRAVHRALGVVNARADDGAVVARAVRARAGAPNAVPPPARRGTGRRGPRSPGRCRQTQPRSRSPAVPR